MGVGNTGLVDPVCDDLECCFLSFAAAALQATESHRLEIEDSDLLRGIAAIVASQPV